MLTLAWVEAATAKFIRIEALREVLSLSLISGKNVVLYGPAGHGKSEAIQAITSAIQGAKVFVQYFGEGMDESRIYGGLNLRRLSDTEDPRIEYDPANSFLASDFAVFEELFDAPTNVLLSLKDTLTARELRNGAQRYQMNTQSIICATNRRPEEIGELGAAANALIERFPLQLEVKWSSYNSGDYLEMFSSVEQQSPAVGKDATLANIIELKHQAQEVTLSGEVRMMLANILAVAVDQGHFVSPRTAIHARDLVKTTAAINGRKRAQLEDLEAISYLPGCSGIASEISDEVKKAVERTRAEVKFLRIDKSLKELTAEMKRATGPVTYLQIHKRAQAFARAASALKVTDQYIRRREELQSKLAKLSMEARDKAVETTDLRQAANA